MKLTRITIAERDYLLAPLTLEQVEHLLTEGLYQQNMRAWKPIADALANAGQSGLLDQLKSDCDYSDYEEISELVVELSGLRNPKPADPQVQKGGKIDFPYIRARLAAHCGWTFAECDRAPFCDVMRLLEYWHEEAPPVDPMFASFVGFQPRHRMRDEAGHFQDSTREEKAALVAQWGGQVIRGADNLPLWMQGALEKEGLLHFPTPTDTKQ